MRLSNARKLPKRAPRPDDDVPRNWRWQCTSCSVSSVTEERAARLDAIGEEVWLHEPTEGDTDVSN